ncbi:hypothetical protein PV437_42715 [Streptomyces scabiei]|uniref:hypothetical protein n=2 Tax=Streptomyces scabiei TaxID=1930 RepID=UPI0029AAF672|nr:hypothetical protein [Streptomyces scabiei]MDX2539822.1 hypothetical protein [Streptomyces scabiei]
MTETRQPVPTPAAVAALPVPYERTRWESAVLAQHLHHSQVAVALVLSHYAGPGGILCEDGIQRSERIRQLMLISPESVRKALRDLECYGLLTRRPRSPGATRRASRAIALTIPARRERPPHTGERP